MHDVINERSQYLVNPGIATCTVFVLSFETCAKDCFHMTKCCNLKKKLSLKNLFQPWSKVYTSYLSGAIQSHHIIIPAMIAILLQKIFTLNAGLNFSHLSGRTWAFCLSYRKDAVKLAVITTSVIINYMLKWTLLKWTLCYNEYSVITNTRL